MSCRLMKPGAMMVPACAEMHSKFLRRHHMNFIKYDTYRSYLIHACVKQQYW